MNFINFAPGPTHLIIAATLVATGLANAAQVPPVVTERPLVLPGREIDARVAAIAQRLATAGLARCPTAISASGMVLQHLTQFRREDRPGMAAAYQLDRGPGVAVVVPGGPADRAGIAAGDVLLSVDDVPIPAEIDSVGRFDQARARARADAVLDLLERAPPVDVTVLRGGAEQRLRIASTPGCPSRVHLARSDQRNAFADGTHVFVTTALVADTQDDELAFVIAHEMAHNILRHAEVMRGPEVRRGFGRTLGRSGEVVRAAEAQADALGAELMLDAGFDPVRGAGVLRRFGGDLRIALFDAHASADDRIAAMRDRAAARRTP